MGVKIALLTLESLASAEAVRRFVLADPERIALVALSDPFRPSAGGAFGQFTRHVKRSGPGLLPYLAANFTLPRLTPRGPALSRRPLAALCRRLGRPVMVTPDVNGASFHQALRRSGADLIVTFHFDQILGAETLAATPLGGVNVHPSLLPRHRGPTPTIHALLDPEPAWGVTVHRLETRIDAGPILAQQPVELPADVSALTAARRLHDAAPPLLEAALEDLPKRSPSALPSTPTLPYQGFPTPEDLRRLRMMGRRAADRADLSAAFATAI